jgi:peptidoglycan/LPS O-acetylase OafA/YrhL
MCPPVCPRGSLPAGNAALPIRTHLSRARTTRRLRAAPPLVHSPRTAWGAGATGGDRKLLDTPAAVRAPDQAARPAIRHVRTIDGLRAVAIVPVVIGHAAAQWMPGGYLGVDIFFVISGFLLTTLIVEQTARGTFRLGDFYKRRMLRIMPALVVAVAATVAGGLVLLSPLELRELGKATAATAVFGSNILFWRQSGYFDPVAGQNPLVHTWSLAVEEQFYLLAPLLSLLAARHRRGLFAALLALAALSLAYAWRTSLIVPSTFFFFTPNRVWEIATGSLFAFARLHWREGTLAPRWLVEGATAAALVAIAASMALFDAFTRHPGPITLVPVLATGVLLLCARRETIANRLLALPPLVWIGLISYSLYLWHQPLLAYARLAAVIPLTDAQLLAVLAASVLAGWLSARFVERPFRRYDRFTRRQAFALFFGATAAMFATGAVLYLANGLPQRFSAARRAMVASPRIAPLPAAPGPAVVFWGDSHAQMYFWAAQRLLAGSPRAVTLQHLGGCPPIPGFDNDWRSRGKKRCSAHNAAVLARLERLPAGTVVLLAARWSNYLNSRPGMDENGEAQSLASRAIYPRRFAAWRRYDVEREVSAGLADAVARLARSGKRVVLIRPVPIQRYEGGKVAYRVADAAALDALGITAAQNRAAQALANRVIDAARGAPGVRVAEPAARLCTGGRCRYVLGGHLLYIDNNHLTNWGAALVMRPLLEGRTR